MYFQVSASLMIIKQEKEEYLFLVSKGLVIIK